MKEKQINKKYITRPNMSQQICWLNKEERKEKEYKEKRW